MVNKDVLNRLQTLVGQISSSPHNAKMNTDGSPLHDPAGLQLKAWSHIIPQHEGGDGLPVT
jgi:hypothetical protein